MANSLLLALAVAVGAAAGVFLPADVVGWAPWLVAACGVPAFLCAARGWMVPAKWLAAGALTAICALLAGAAQHRAADPPLRTLLDERLGSVLEIEGRLMADAAVGESGVNLRVQVERVWIDTCPEPATGGVSITVVGELAANALGEWRAGRVVRMPASLRRPARYLNAGVADQELLLARRGIALVGTVKSAALVQVVAPGPWYDEAAAAVRARVRGALTRHAGHHDPQSAAVAVAILIGDRGALDHDVEKRLQEAGTYHVIAISGGNIAILAGLILGGLWLLGVRGGWAAGAAVALLAAYAHLAGGGPSVIRATVMAVLYLALRVIDQRTAPRHAMALTAAAVLLASPLAIADVGLWLTFGATAAIVAGAIYAPLPRAWWLKAPAALVLASACAELALMPIGAFVFQRVTLAGLIVNLAAVPAMALVQVSAMATAAADASGWTAAAAAAGWITHAGVRILIDSAVLVDLAPWLTWRVPSPSLVVMAAYYAAVLLFVFRWRHVALGVAAAVLFIWIATAPPALARRFGDGRLHVTMIDVGQGDAVLATLPNGRTLLVDTGGVAPGGGFDIGDRVIGPVLRARGLGRLDYVAITHGDADHVGGAASVVRDFDPFEVWDGVFVNNLEPIARLRIVASRRRAAWRTLQRGDRLDLGGVELRVHHPPLPDWERQKVRNDDSLVLELRYGQVSVLLTGDIGREVEQALLPTLDLLPTVVLKSPHHGSNTSSSDVFLRAIKPRVVLISAGRGNPFGHPTRAVLDRYHAIGATIYRTDRDGQIDLTTDGQLVSVATFVRGRSLLLNTKDTKDTKTTNSSTP